VPLTSHSVERERELAGVWVLVQPWCNEIVLPEDDPAGSKHVGGFYSEGNIHTVH
jgi:hypothetical protein